MSERTLQDVLRELRRHILTLAERDGRSLAALEHNATISAILVLLDKAIAEAPDSPPAVADLEWPDIDHNRADGGRYE